MSQYSFILLPLVLLVRLKRAVANRIYYPLKTLVLKKVFRLECDSSVRFIGDTIVRAYERGAISIGHNTIFQSGTQHNLVGLTNPSVLCACHGAKITIGHDSGFSSAIIYASESIQIGDYVKVGGNVRIIDNDFHPLEWDRRRPPECGSYTRKKAVKIGNDVFIGTNAIILKGSKIGDRSIIAAGSVVFGLIAPPDSMIKGNPAVVINK